MRNTLRNFGFASLFLIAIVATALIKHVPLWQLISTSSLVILLGCLIAASIQLGVNNVLDAFAGKNARAAESLVKITAMASALGSVLGLQRTFILLQSPDAVGPYIALALISMFYGLVVGGYLVVANKLSQLANQLVVYATAVVFLNLSITATVIFIIANE